MPPSSAQYTVSVVTDVEASMFVPPEELEGLKSCQRLGVSERFYDQCPGGGAYRFNPRIRTPAPTMRMPIQSRPDGRSPRKRNANTATSTRLSLSTGATFEASPTFSARK